VAILLGALAIAAPFILISLGELSVPSGQTRGARNVLRANPGEPLSSRTRQY
jgi:hypothetical protein